MSIKKIGLSALVMSSAFIAGCGGSDSSNDSTTHLTYYNLSSNKALVKLYDDDINIANVDYERSSMHTNIESGTSTIELKVDIDEDSTETLYEEDLNLGKDKLNYLVSLNGLGEGGEAPLLYTFDNKSGDVKEDTFQFNMMYLAPQISEKYGAITVQFVDTEDSTLIQEFVINYQEQQTLTIDDDAERYYLILKAGNETILETSSVSFNNIQYFFALKDSTLNDDVIPALVRLTNRSNPTELRDTDLSSYFRVYNSANDLGNINVKLNKLSEDKLANITDVAPDTLSDFVTLETDEVGTYDVSIEYADCLADDSCTSSPYSFENGTDTTIVYYRDTIEEGLKLKNKEFVNTSREATDNHQITFVNLLNNMHDEGEDDSDAVNLYFVKSGENFENTSYRIMQRELGEIYQYLTIPSGVYDIYLTYEDDDTIYTVSRVDSVAFGNGQGEKSGDWIYIAEPQTDAEGNTLLRKANLNSLEMN